MKTSKVTEIVVVVAGVLGLICTGDNGWSQTQGASQWKAPDRAAKKTNPVPAETSSLARGKKLYVQECVTCHGATGKGDGPKASQLTVKAGDLSGPDMREQTDGALFWKISEGKTPMPAYRLRFSERERWMIVNYIRSLGGKQNAAASTKASAASAASAPSSSTALATASKPPPMK